MASEPITFSFEEDIAPLSRNLSRDVLESDFVKMMEQRYGAGNRSAIQGGLSLDAIASEINVRRAAAAQQLAKNQQDLRRSEFENQILADDVSGLKPSESALFTANKLKSIVEDKSFTPLKKAEEITNLIGMTDPEVFRKDKQLLQRMTETSRNLFALGTDKTKTPEKLPITRKDILSIDKELTGGGDQYNASSVWTAGDNGLLTTNNLTKIEDAVLALSYDSSEATKNLEELKKQGFIPEAVRKFYMKVKINALDRVKDASPATTTANKNKEEEEEEEVTERFK